MNRAINIIAIATLILAMVSGCNQDGSPGAPGSSPEELVPAAPSALGSSPISTSQIGLIWQDNSNNETGFKLEWSRGYAGYWNEVRLSANTTSYRLSGCAEGTIYYFRIRSYNDAGNSSYSNTVSATTNLAAPSLLNASALSSTQINLTWWDNSNNEEGFKLEWARSSSGPWNEVRIAANSTSYTLGGCATGATYWFRIRAYNSNTNSSYSNTTSATTPVDGIIAPSNLTARALSSTQIALTWNDNSNNETGFKLEWARSSSGPWNEVRIGANQTSYTLSGCAVGSTYWFRIRAYNSSLNSAYSTTVSATTPGITPPSELNARAISSTQIALTWRDNSNNESGFKLEWARSNSGPWNEVRIATNSTSYTLDGCAAGATYWFRIRAYNSTTNSLYSNTASATTPSGNHAPNPPQNPTPSNGAVNWPVSQNTLSWSCSDPDGDRLTFDVYFGATNTPARIGSTQSLSYPVNISYGNNYYWKIIASDGRGGSSTSATLWQFGTEQEQQRSLELITPEENDTWTIGETHRVIWRHSGLTGTTVNVAVEDDNNGFHDIATRRDVETGDLRDGYGAFEWTVGDDIAPGSCLVVVYSETYGLEDYVTINVEAPEEIATLNVVRDTFVSESLPDANYGDSEILVTGYSGGSARRTYLFFNILGSIPDNADIIDAELQCVVERVDGSQFEVGVGYMTSDWSEDNATWNNDPQWQASRNNSVLSPTETGDFTFDVTAVVQNIVDRGVDYGIILRKWDESGANNFFRLDSRETGHRLRLVITYQ